MEQISGDLSDRLERLERKQAELQRTNRRLSSVTGALLLLAGGLSLMGQTARREPHILEAEQFVMRDNHGTVRGAMGITPDGAVGLNLADAKGHTRITLDISADGLPGLDFYDSQGKLGATFAMDPIGTARLGLFNASGKLRTTLDVNAPHTPGLAFYHQGGKPA